MEFGGSISSGATYNANNPANEQCAVIFTDPTGKFQFNQFNVSVQRAVPSEGPAWDWAAVRFSVRYRRY